MKLPYLGYLNKKIKIDKNNHLMTENKFGFEFVSVKPTWEWNQHMPWKSIIIMFKSELDSTFSLVKTPS